MVKVAMDLEDLFHQLAEIDGGEAVILCDRGVMDGKGYISPEGWQEVVEENNYKIEDIRDNRYDAVLHLVTAADGAEKYYNLDDNTARYETDPKVAIETDKRLENAWAGHPSHL